MRVEIVSQRTPWLVHEQLDVIVKAGVLRDRAQVVDLKDHERGLVWIDGRFSHVLPPGLFAYWTAFRDVKVEVVDARGIRFTHPELAGKPARIELRCAHTPDARALELLALIHDRLGFQEIKLEVVVRNDEIRMPNGESMTKPK